MKRIILVFLLGAAALGLLAGCGTGNGETASVQSVSMITGAGSLGVMNSYAGKVVSGETAELKKDENKTVQEVFVEEGDMVSAGDPLFSYDMEAMELSLEKLYLEQESYENTISASNSQISELQSQKSGASSSQQLSYTLQINSLEADIREAEYNKALKAKEIEAMEADMDNTVISSPISGRVMTVSDEDTTESYTADGESVSDAFITVMDVSSYRVEGQISELNAGALTEGMPVVIRSRIDSEQTWTGTLTAIDWDNPTSSRGENDYYSYTGDMTTTTKYPFYVELDSTDGLLLGQHIYIEPVVNGDDESLMLPAYYINDADSDPWVWAANGRDRLEKRSLTLGEYDGDMDEYEILSGLDYDDYIAFPEESLSAGMSVTYYDEESFGGEDDYDDGGYSDAAIAVPLG